MIDLPPPPFDKPYSDGPVVEHRYTLQQLAELCHNPFAFACSWPPVVKGGACAKFMPVVGPGGVALRLYITLDGHENAHCHGCTHPVVNGVEKWQCPGAATGVTKSE